jgi:hypothetical protein
MVQAPPSQQPGQALGRRRVAAIDIGTNSIHLLVAEVDPELRSFSVLVAEKATTRLGERDPETGDLSSDAIERAFRTLRQDRGWKFEGNAFWIELRSGMGRWRSWTAACRRKHSNLLPGTPPPPWGVS